MSVEEVVDHLKDCLEADAVIVTEDGDSLVDALVSEGWTWEETSYVGGKRVRMLSSPE